MPDVDSVPYLESQPAGARTPVYHAVMSGYLRFARSFNESFPGFTTDVHGLVEEEVEPGKRRYYVDCVKLD